LASCKGGGVKSDPILRLSADEALEQGKELMEREKFVQATQYLDHAFEVAPNSATGREALLLSADAYFLGGGTANFVKAESKYRDFLNRFPTSDRADYVQMQIANCLAEQMLRPDRDQTATIKALTAFEGVLQLYPTSTYAEEVQARIVEIRQALAEHEYRVGRYNYRRRLYTAAAWRLEGLTEDYPDFQEMDKVLYILGMAFGKGGRPDKAVEVFESLRSEYPESRFIKKIPDTSKFKRRIERAETEKSETEEDQEDQEKDTTNDSKEKESS
jgi:outer membrane protein assembly factor BamD